MLFHLHFVQESGWRPAVCVRDSARSLSLLQSDFFREEPVFSSLPHFSVFLSSLYYDSSPGFSLVSPSAPSPWSPTCQETVLCLQSPVGPSLYNTPQGPRLSLTLCLHLGCSFCLAHFPLISPPFVTNSTVSPLENLHWPLPPTPEDTGVFPRLCPHNCEQTAGTELPVQCHHEAHVCLFVRLCASSSLAPNTVLGAG